MDPHRFVFQSGNEERRVMVATLAIVHDLLTIAAVHNQRTLDEYYATSLSPR